MKNKPPLVDKSTGSGADNKNQSESIGPAQTKQADPGKKTKFPHIKLKTLKRLILVSISVCCLAVLVYIGFAAYFLFLVDVDVQYTNLTSNSATVIWVSDIDQPGMAIANTKESGSFQIGKDGDYMAYDDRDYASAEEIAAMKLQERVLEDPAQQVVQSDVEVKDMGRYKVHHVTFRGLEPNTQYYVMVGDGSLFKSPITPSFTTRESNDQLDVPSPAYGTVVLDNSGKVLQDGALKLYITDADLNTISEPISAAISETGTWYVDLSSLYTNDGERFFAKYTQEQFDDMYEMHDVITKDGTYQLNVSTQEDAPAPEFILDQATMLSLGSLAPTPSYSAFLSNVSADQEVKGLIAMDYPGEATGGSINTTDDEEEEEDDPYAGQVEWENEKADKIRNPNNTDWSKVIYDDESDGSDNDIDDVREPGGYRVITYDEDGNVVGPTATIGEEGGTDSGTQPGTTGDEEGAGTVQEEAVEPPPPRYICCARDAYNTYTGDREDPSLSTPAQECLPGYVELKEADSPGVCNGFWDARASTLEEQIEEAKDIYDPDRYAGECCTDGSTNYWSGGRAYGYCQAYNLDTWDPDGSGRYTHTASKDSCLSGGDDNIDVTQGTTGAANQAMTHGACCIKPDGGKVWFRGQASCGSLTFDQFSTESLCTGSGGSTVNDQAQDAENGLGVCCYNTDDGVSSWNPNSVSCSGSSSGGSYIGTMSNSQCISEANKWRISQELEEPSDDSSDSGVCCINGADYYWDSDGGSCNAKGHSYAVGVTNDRSCIEKNAVSATPAEPLPPGVATCTPESKPAGAFCDPDDCERRCFGVCEGDFTTVQPEGIGITSYFWHWSCNEDQSDPSGSTTEPGTDPGTDPGDDDTEGIKSPCLEGAAQSQGGTCDTSCVGGCSGEYERCVRREYQPLGFEYPFDYFKCVDMRNRTASFPQDEGGSNSDGESGENESESNPEDDEQTEPEDIRSACVEGPAQVAGGTCVSDCQNSCSSSERCVRDQLQPLGFEYPFDYFKCEDMRNRSSFIEKIPEYLSSLYDDIAEEVKSFFSLNVSAQEKLDNEREPTILYVPERQAYIFEEQGKYMFHSDNKVYFVRISGDEGSYTIYLDFDGDSIYDPATDELISADPEVIGLKKVSDSTEYEVKRGFNLVSFDFLTDEFEPVSSKFLEGLNKRYNDAFYSISKYQSGGWQVTGVRRDTTYGSNDFQIVPGVGYLLKAKKDVTLDLTGVEINSPVAVSFINGWNLIAVHGSEDFYTANSLLESINSENINADNVSRWDSSTASYDGYQRESANDGDTQNFGFDFPVFEQNAYFVRVVSGEGRWTP